MKAKAQKLDTERLLYALAATVGLSLLVGALRGGALLLRAIDGFFVGGSLVFCYGLCSAALLLGGFDLFSYSGRRIRHMLKKEKAERKGETLPPEKTDEKAAGSYYEFMSEKAKERRLDAESLIAGGCGLLASALCMLLR